MPSRIIEGADPYLVAAINELASQGIIVAEFPDEYGVPTFALVRNGKILVCCEIRKEETQQLAELIAVYDAHIVNPGATRH